MRLRMCVAVAVSVVPGPAARNPRSPVLGIAALGESGSTQLILEV
jgi:hypothetical protein